MPLLADVSTLANTYIPFVFLAITRVGTETLLPESVTAPETVALEATRVRSVPELTLEPFTRRDDGAEASMHPDF